MGTLVYSCIASLDGFTTDADGGFDWAAPDEEVHAFVNDAERPVGTYLYGRGMYATMRFWQSPPPGLSAVSRAYADLWQAADKVVFSTTLPAVSTPRTTLQRTFDPDAVRALVRAADRPVSIGGPTLAAHALRAGLVDELHLLAVPHVVGGGTPWLPAGLRLELELLAERRFGGGTVHTGYRVAR